jgi:proteasome lid subunit RPN8/RPN11
MVETVIPVSNVAANPAAAYHMDEHELSAVLPAVARAGQDVLAVYHSHPNGITRPSQADIDEWAFPEAAMIILSPAAKRAAAWRVRGQEVTPVDIHLVRPDAPASTVLSPEARAAVIISAILGSIAVILIALALLPPAPPIP